ncbi:MAG: DUF3231 family protein [Halanaerobiaceae bacterium]
MVKLFDKKSKTKEKQSMISTEEAHRIWVKTQTRYMFIENIQLFSNFVHDIDFKIFLKKLQQKYQNHVDVLEKELTRYSIKSPEPNKTDVEVIANTEIISDKQIARIIYSFAQLALNNCMKTLNNTIYNDNIREIMIKIAKDEVNIYYEVVDYFKLKGWLAFPPLYPNAKENIMVAANEIWELWQHLKYRYINVHQTKIYISKVANKDFQLVLTAGIKILENQIKEIENHLLNFGVKLPSKYPENIPEPKTKQLYDDEFIFQSLLHQMRNATTIHGFALQELIVNNELRNLFKKMLLDEINIIDKLIRYGKLKGWIENVPVYRS